MINSDDRHMNIVIERLQKLTSGAPDLNAWLGTALTLANENGEYTIRLRQQEMNLNDVFEDMVIPVLLAAGYSKESIDMYLEVSGALNGEQR